MTFEESFCNLYDKFGEDFNWTVISPANKYYSNEAKNEIKPGHPLYGLEIWSVAKCESKDDVMFVLEDGRYIILHLTYCENIDPSYPNYISFNYLQDAIEYIEKQYCEEYC